jgi:ABC-type dipeptide/oligopeptide/nickel transport system permease component
MARFLLRRFLAALLFVILVALGALILGRLAPGDPAADLMGRSSQTSIQATRAASGYGKPLPAQLAHWIGGLIRLDLGMSSRFGVPVKLLVWDKARNTAQLASLAVLLAVLIGIPAGVLTATRPRSASGLAIAAIAVALVSCPPVVGVLVLLWAGATTGLLSVAPGHATIPVLAIALPLAATIERLQSRAMTDVLSAPQWPAAAARGLTRSRLLWAHALRHAVRPLIGVSGVLVAGLFSGSLAVETLTAWPGLGRLTFEALVGRDLYLVAGCALAGAVLIAAANFLADAMRAYIDPRVRDAR